MLLRSVTVVLFYKILLTIFIFMGSATAKGTRYVTCGSVLKLMNIDFNVRLHSHDVKYATGSGQQLVTGTDAKEDENSYWLVKAEYKKQCSRGRPIKCGDIIRLEHTATKKNLHSHLISSLISGNQEISAYGDYRGEGDTGDNWQLICQTDFWEREDSIMLKHVDTNAYLAVSGRIYSNSGHQEVVGNYSPTKIHHVEWKTMEGLFIHPADFKVHQYEHTEL